jgi:hypothetical protein
MLESRLKSWYVAQPEKSLTVFSFLAEEWDHQFFEADPSRERDEKPDHAEEHDCRGFVWLLGKGW